LKHFSRVPVAIIPAWYSDLSLSQRLTSGIGLSWNKCLIQWLTLKTNPRENLFEWYSHWIHVKTAACSKFVRQRLCFQKSHHTRWFML